MLKTQAVQIIRIPTQPEQNQLTMVQKSSKRDKKRQRGEKIDTSRTA